MAKKPAKSYTSRTYEWMRKDRCWHAETVEKWEGFSGVRQDLFNCIDAIALARREIGPIMALQITSTGISSRYRKIMATPRMTLWVKSGGRLAIVGWRKIGTPARWKPRVIEFRLADDNHGLEAFEIKDESEIEAWRQGFTIPYGTKYAPDAKQPRLFHVEHAKNDKNHKINPQVLDTL